MARRDADSTPQSTIDSEHEKENLSGFLLSDSRPGKRNAESPLRRSRQPWSTKCVPRGKGHRSALTIGRAIYLAVSTMAYVYTAA